MQNTNQPQDQQPENKDAPANGNSQGKDANSLQNVSASNEAIRAICDVFDLDVSGIEVFDSRITQILVKKIKTLKQSNEESKRENALFRAFVGEAEKSGIEFISDAYQLADLTEVKIDPSKNQVSGMKEIIAELKQRRPYLFKQGNAQDADIPMDFNISLSNSLSVQNLKQKAQGSGALQDIQQYWAAKRQSFFK